MGGDTFNSIGAGIGSIFGWEEEDIYTTSSAVVPLFDKNDRVVKKATIFAALSKQKNEGDGKDLLEYYQLKGFKPLQRFYKKGKSTYIDHLPEVEIEGLSFSTKPLQSLLNSQEGEDVTIKSIQLQKPTGMAFAKYSLQKSHGYDPDTDILHRNDNFFKYENCESDVVQNKLKISCTSIGSYLDETVEVTKYNLEDEFETTKAIGALYEEEEEYTDYVYDATKDKKVDVKKGQKVNLPYIGEKDEEYTSYHLITDEEDRARTGELETKTNDTRKVPAILYTEYTATEDETVTIPGIVSKTATRKVTKAASVTVPAYTFTIACYHAKYQRYVRKDTGKVFRKRMIFDFTKELITDQYTKSTQWTYTYLSEAVNSDPRKLEYITSAKTLAGAKGKAKADNAELLGQGEEEEILSSTEVQLPKEKYNVTVDTPDEDCYFVDYSTSEKGTKYLLLTMDEAEAKGLKRDPVSVWKNDSKGTLDALPVVLIRHGKLNLTTVEDENGNKTDLNEILTVERYKNTKKFLRKCKIDLQEVTDGVHEGMDEETYGQITEIYLTYGLHFNDDWQIEDDETELTDPPKGISKYLYTLFNTINTKFPAMKESAGLDDTTNRVRLHIREQSFKDTIYWNVSEDKLLKGTVRDYIKDPRMPKTCHKGFVAHKCITRKYKTKHLRYWHVHSEKASAMTSRTGYIEWEDREIITLLPDNEIYEGKILGRGKVECKDFTEGRTFYEVEADINAGYTDGEDVEYRNIYDPYNRIVYNSDKSLKPNGVNPLEAHYSPYAQKISLDDNSSMTYTYVGGSDNNEILRNYKSVYYSNYDRYVVSEIAFDKTQVEVGDNNGTPTYATIEKEASGKNKGDGSFFSQTKKVQSLYIYCQQENNTVHNICLENVWCDRVVYRPDGADIHSYSSVDDNCYLPLLWFPIKSLNAKQAVQLYGRSLFLQVHSVQHEHLEWYESESFNLTIGPIVQIAMYVITAIVTYFTAGAAFKPMVILQNMIIATLISEAGKIITTQFGATIGIIFTVVSTAFTFGKSFMSALNNANVTVAEMVSSTCITVLKVSAEISQIVAGDVNKKLASKFEEFRNEAESRMEEIKDANTEIVQLDLITPTDIVQINNMSNPVFMTPNSFLNIAVSGTTNLDFSVANYVDRNVSNFTEQELNLQIIE